MIVRTCIKEPILELYNAYGALQNAIDAHLAGRISEAAEQFKLANCPVVWTWLNTAWMGVVQHVVTLRPPGDTRTIPRTARDLDRNIAKNVKQTVLARDGYRCRYCGMPVVHADIRKIAHKLHPEAVPWNPRVASQQHSAFQAFWLQFDHVEPHSHGGRSSVDNVVVTCALCNFGKDRHTLRQLDLEDPRLRSPLPSEYDGLERFRSAAPKPTKVVDEAQAVVPRRGGKAPNSEGSASFSFPGAKISGEYQQKFDRLLREHLIPEFCSDPNRRMQPSGFVPPAKTIAERDCHRFMVAWQAGLIKHVGRGQYRAPMSSAHEQFFNSGLKTVVDRFFYLSIEPIITVGGLARLHFDHGWPLELLGMQSKGDTFDLVAYLEPNGPVHIACEVKKSDTEVDTLISLMNEYGRDWKTEAPTAKLRKNAWKKMAVLRSEPIPTFWVLGPAGRSHVFNVKRGDDELELIAVADSTLKFQSRAPG